MGSEILIAVLALVTFGIVMLVAMRSKAKTEERRKDPDAPKSTLAADAPNTRS